MKTSKRENGYWRRKRGSRRMPRLLPVDAAITRVCWERMAEGWALLGQEGGAR
jgi:hypothetical protein